MPPEEFTNLWTATPCPRCTGKLKPLDVSPYKALGCGQCRGVWLDHVGSGIVAAGGGDEITAANGGMGAYSDDSPAKGKCPTCGAPLETRTTHGGAITLDVCMDHGTWFDGAELETTRAAAKGVILAKNTRPQETQTPVTPSSIVAKPSISRAPDDEPEFSALDALQFVQLTFELISGVLSLFDNDRDS